ncbi:MAG: NADH-quinone oxidoreductase subunit C [Chitinophagaceae bacterium]|nr:MAG: NADH dehydrogenase subunit C [Bacteroidetes bacterium OLB11]MCC6448069.1 NADH-quinone oxidoreductase subunit C [Chitinophagaceae bacterium]HMN31869.1 NADH-quinone oxidoreductase subunit C [Chitinophagaceae bacterium]
MQNEEIKQTLITKFGEHVSHFEEPYGMLTFEVDKDNALKVLTFLKEDSGLGFTFLNDLTAVHYPDMKGRELCVVYMVQNIYHSLRVRIKVFIDIEKPEVFTATSIFETANWLEREAYDFFGVQFVGHPNLIRIMNVDEMDYFPLRKDFKLEEQTRKDKDDNMFGR